MPNNKTENYIRLHLLNNEAVEVLRATFLKIITQTYYGDVDQFLEEFEEDIKTMHKLSHAQRKLFFPDNGRTNVDEWDVSLLSFILIHCCSLEGKLCISKLRDLMIKTTSAFADINAFLSYNKTKIDQMREDDVIDDVQYNKLYPRNSSNTSTLTDWDLHLLLSMLVVFSIGQNREKLYDMLRECIARDIRLHCPNPNLADYLNRKRSECNNMLKSGQISQREYNQLFPKDGGMSDFNNWDRHLIQMFVSKVCTGLNNETLANVTAVRQIRNEMLAHKARAEMDDCDFLDTWADLKKAIESIIKQEVPSMMPEWTQKHKEIHAGPFDVTGAINILKEYYCKETSEFQSIIGILKDIEHNNEMANKEREHEHNLSQQERDKLIKINKDIAENVQYLVDTDKSKDMYTASIDAECINIEIHVTNTNEQSKQRTERAIRLAIQNILKGSPTEIKIQTVLKLVEGMTRDGTEIVDVQSGSVLIKVKCISLKGIINVLLHTGTEELRKEMEDELFNIFGTDIRLEFGITEESKQTIINDLDRLKNERERQKPLVDKNNASNSMVQAIGDTGSSNIEKQTTKDTPLPIEVGPSSNIKVPRAKKIHTFSIQCPEDTDDCIISSCTVLPTGDIVMCDLAHANIKLIDKHYTYRSVLTLPGLPWDSCLSGDDNTEVLVTVPNKMTIYRIKVGDDMMMKGEIVVGGTCRGITCCRVGIAVVMGYSGGYIQLIHYDGTHLRRVDTSIQLSYTSYVTSIMNGRQLVVAEYESSRVLSLDVDTGKTVFEYKDDDLNSPTSVTSDSQDNIYVAGLNPNNVHMISTTGEKVGDILTRTDGLNCPRGLEYNRYNVNIILQPDRRRSELCVYKIIK